MRFLSVGLGFALLAVEFAPGYVQNRRLQGDPLHRTDFAAIRYVLHDSTAPGLENGDGTIVITPGSAPVAAVLAALESWSSIPASAVKFADLGSANIEPRNDGVQLITFADSPLTRAILGNAVAVTTLRSESNGELTDTDIIFNPTLPFSTNLDARSFDIQSTLTHELGHALGLDHSGVAGATMFAQVARENRGLATLTADDIGFAAEVYPAGLGGEFGSLEGIVRRTTGEPVRGAAVSAFDPRTNTVVGAISAADGRYRISATPTGDYWIFAEPLDGPAAPNQFGPAARRAELSFRSDFHGGRENPRKMLVTAAETAQADITVEPGAPTVNIEGAGSAPVDQVVQSLVGATVVAGMETNLALFGEGLDDPEITESSLSFLGAAIEVTPGSFEKGTIRLNDGRRSPLIRVRVTAAPKAPEGLVSFLLSTESEVSLLSGGIRIEQPISPPLLPAAGVVNAASFQTGPLIPGGIFSIFGEHLGPEMIQGAVGRLNPITGRLLTTAGDTTVTVNGVPAPLFFVREDQINLQAPFEIAGSPSAEIVVSYKLVPGAPVSAPVSVTAPGVFTFPDGVSVVALNQDGSLNGPGNPAAAGEAVSIFGTGQGLVTPPLTTGEAAAGPESLSLVDADVSAMIDEMPADVLFAGMAPGFVGLLQVNLRVPVTAGGPGPVPLHLQIGGVPAQPGLTLAIE